MSTPNNADYAVLSVDIYKDNASDRGVGSWSKLPDDGDNPASGLKAQAYKNVNYDNHVVIAIGGTDSLLDISADHSFIDGSLDKRF